MMEFLDLDGRRLSVKPGMISCVQELGNDRSVIFVGDFSFTVKGGYSDILDSIDEAIEASRSKGWNK